MKPFSPAIAIGLLVAFLAGFASHLLYQRWNPSTPAIETDLTDRKNSEFATSVEPPSFPVTHLPAQPHAQIQVDAPPVQAREVEKIRKLAGSQARVRGRVFRVGHSAKSNTYFLNFGPSREALTAVIFASAVELFEKSKLEPKVFEGKEVELRGEIKDHPQYGLELILEHPAQIKVLD
ncbi:MAG TPA: hypothetical protein VEG60_29730 [Candidatus Binatia bacterium]|nr:hypothetical protein [Candidatus Binatia bacterium]